MSFGAQRWTEIYLVSICFCNSPNSGCWLHEPFTRGTEDNTNGLCDCRNQCRSHSAQGLHGIINKLNGEQMTEYCDQVLKML